MECVWQPWREGVSVEPELPSEWEEAGPRAEPGSCSPKPDAAQRSVWWKGEAGQEGTLYRRLCLHPMGGGSPR